MNEIAFRYGASLFALAIENNEVELWQKEIKELILILKENNDFILLLKNEFIPFDERVEVLEKTFKGYRNEYISLIKIVMRNHRVSMLIDILLAFNSEANQYRGVKEGLMYSASSVDNKTKLEIEKSVSKLEGCPVDLKVVIDPTLIGGFKVVINNHIYDASISNKLTQLKTKLLRNEGEL